MVTVKKTGYKILTLLMPALIILAIIVGHIVSGIVGSAKKEIKKIGYVDQTAGFTEIMPDNADNKIKLIIYKTEQVAKDDLIKNEISEYFVISNLFVNLFRVSFFIFLFLDHVSKLQHRY